MQSHPLEQYLADCRLAHSTKAATPETAFYSALANLLNEAGKPRDVRVHCVMGLKDQGAGMPDGGLFTPDQFNKSEGKLKPGQVAGPSRGVIECKPPKKAVIAIADTKQVSDSSRVAFTRCHGVAQAVAGCIPSGSHAVRAPKT